MPVHPVGWRGAWTTPWTIIPLGIMSVMRRVDILKALAIRGSKYADPPNMMLEACRVADGGRSRAGNLLPEPWRAGQHTCFPRENKLNCNVSWHIGECVRMPSSGTRLKGEF